EEILLGEVEEANGCLSSFTPRKPSHDQSTHRSKPSRTTPDITSVHHTEVSVEDSFPVTVAVDRAMHLNLKGLRGQFLETIPSDTQSSSNSPVEISSPQLIPDSMSSPNRAIDECLGVGSSLPLLPTEISQHHRDSDHEEEDKQSNKDNLSEEEHQEETHFRQDEEAGDDEEDEDFEEVVLKPRHLNEVTTLTDRTSPWTSILSEPDLVSVESIESDMSENEDTSLVATLESGLSNEKHIEEVYHHSSDESARDASDTERDFNRMQSIDQTQQKESNSPNKSSDASPTPQPATDFSAAGTQDINEKQLQPYP
ncbi:hypothetical protein XENOCAPTIV_028554, partial [Xenoophorus captivus]